MGGLGDNGAPVGTAELYDPNTGTFTATGNTYSGRYLHTATLLNDGTVLIAGGASPTNGLLANAEIYNPATGTFAPTAGSMNVNPIYNTATLLNNGTVLVTETTTAELYDPATGTFTSAGNMSFGQDRHTATLLNNGKVLLAGGEGFSASVSGAQLYDPAAGTFTATGSLNSSRINHTATLLNNGMVLIAGGSDGSGNPPLGPAPEDAELYDPANGIFILSAPLDYGRYGHTATLLQSGTVLMAGGNFDNYSTTTPPPPPPNMAIAELYQLGTLTPPNLVSIAVTPATATLSVGSTQHYIAQGTFNNGVTSYTQQLASVTWSSTDVSGTNVAQITNDATNHGLALGLSTGTATVTACAGSICGSTTVTVQ